MKTNHIYQGDCLEIMKTFEDKSVDLVLTDPPYGIGINKMGFTNNLQGGVAKRTDYKGMADWDSVKLTKDYFDEIFRVSKNQIIFGGNYYTEFLKPKSCWIVWDKRTADKYSNDFADGEMAWTSFDKPMRIFRFLWSGMLQENMKHKETRHHPTLKPTELMKWCLEKYSEDGDTILDPFLGSGTTAVACKQLNRNYIGIEISEKYCEIARERLKQEQLF